MFQYPGGVGARSHCARCRDTAWRCALTPAVAEPARAPLLDDAPSLLVVESHSDGTSVGDDGGGESELHRGASSRGGSGPTAAYHYHPSPHPSVVEPSLDWVVSGVVVHVRRGIPRTPPRPSRAGAAAHARLRRTRKGLRRSPRG